MNSEAKVFVGASGTDRYRAAALIAGLKLYRKTNIKPNTGWTPTAMLRTASHFTGKPYARGQFTQAITDLEQWLNAVR